MNATTKRWVMTACLLFLGAVAGSLRPAASPAGEEHERIARVENGLLRKPIRIAGEPDAVTTLRDLMKEGNIPGLSVAVVDDGRVAWARGYGVADLRGDVAVTTETMFSAGSITKAVTALAVLRLVDAGKLDLDRDVNTLLVGWKVPRPSAGDGAIVTLRQLLSHTSGIGRHFPQAYAPGEPMPTLLQLLNGEAPAKSARVEVLHAPGTFDYSAAAFLVVQQCLTDVTGESFPAIVEREVFAPAGMRHSTFTQPEKDRLDPTRAAAHFGTQAKSVAFPELASSGLWTTPTDLARLLISLQKSGEPGGLLSKRSYQQLQTPVLNNAALGFFIIGSGDSKRLRVRGTDGTPSDGYSAFLTGYAGTGKGAVVMSSTGGLRLGFSLLRSIATEYAWPEYIPVRTVLPSAPSSFTPYLGKFEIDGGVVTFTTEGQSLFLNLPSRRLELLRSGPHTYFANQDMFNEVELRFIESAQGAIDTVVLQYQTHAVTGKRVR